MLCQDLRTEFSQILSCFHLRSGEQLLLKDQLSSELFLIKKVSDGMES